MTARRGAPPKTAHRRNGRSTTPPPAPAPEADTRRVADIALDATDARVKGTRVTASIAATYPRTAADPLHEATLDINSAQSRERFFREVLRRATPLLEPGYRLPTVAELDRRLIAQRKKLETDARDAARQQGASSAQYTVTNDGTYWQDFVQGAPSGPPKRLANFSALIVDDLRVDNGVDTSSRMRIEAQVGGRHEVFTIEAPSFASMNWVPDKLGAGAIVEPGHMVRDRLRHAIQTLSPRQGRRTVYLHTGWRLIDGAWVYLHAGGALGASGPVDGVDVELPKQLASYVLPAPPDVHELRDAVRASLKLVELAPKLLVPLIAAAYRAPLPAVSMDTAVTLIGTSGFGKTTAALLAQQHFGAGWNIKNTPSNWDSTAYFINEALFLPKDALCLIDDLRPSGQDGPKHLRAAQVVIHAIGNVAARGRMRADTTLRDTHPPRATALITAEDLPIGYSDVARVVVVKVEAGDLTKDAALTAAQKAGSAGVYAQAMAGYIQWIAPRYDDLAHTLPARCEALRDGMRAFTHKHGVLVHDRAPSNLAQLQLGLEYAVRFAIDVEALSAADGPAWLEQHQVALRDVLLEQEQAAREADPLERCMELLRSAIASGEAHLADTRGNVPRVSAPGRFGWRKHESHDFTGASTDDFRPQGPRIGWIDELGAVRLIPAASHKAVVRQATATSPFLTPGPRIAGMLHERKLLLSVETEANGRTHFAPYFRAEGGRLRCLHLAEATVFGDDAEAEEELP